MVSGILIIATIAMVPVCNKKKKKNTAKSVKPGLVSRSLESEIQVKVTRSQHLSD